MSPELVELVATSVYNNQMKHVDESTDASADVAASVAIYDLSQVKSTPLEPIQEESNSDKQQADKSDEDAIDHEEVAEDEVEDSINIEEASTWEDISEEMEYEWNHYQSLVDQEQKRHAAALNKLASRYHRGVDEIVESYFL